MTDPNISVEETSVNNGNEIASPSKENKQDTEINNETAVNSELQQEEKSLLNEQNKDATEESNQIDDNETQVMAPPKETTESTTATTQNTIAPLTRLPVARIKRIVKQDEDVTAISTPAVYAVAAATEMFIKYFSEQALVRARAEKRKRLMYKDFSNSVESLNQLQFLSQLIPQPRKMSDLVAKNLVSRPDLPKGQTTLAGFTSTKSKANGDTDIEANGQGDGSSSDRRVSTTSGLDDDGDISMTEAPSRPATESTDAESTQGTAANNTSSPVIRRHSLMDLIED